MEEQHTPLSKIDPFKLPIRLVQEADLVALEWDGEYQKYRLMYAGIFRRAQQGEILMWVIEDGQQAIIGQAFVMLTSSERDAADGRQHAYLFAFRVRPEWRNRGVGTRLMAFIETDLLQRGFSYLTLNVAKDNPGARRLYERLGYKVIASKPGIWSYRDDQGKVRQVVEPAWRMMKRLRQTRG